MALLSGLLYIVHVYISSISLLCSTGYTTLTPYVLHQSHTAIRRVLLRLQCAGGGEQLEEGLHLLLHAGIPQIHNLRLHVGQEVPAAPRAQRMTAGRLSGSTPLPGNTHHWQLLCSFSEKHSRDQNDVCATQKLSLVERGWLWRLPAWHVSFCTQKCTDKAPPT